MTECPDFFAATGLVAISLAGFSDPDRSYRDALAADLDQYARAGDDSVAFREVQQRFPACNNMPCGEDGEREAGIRVMRAMERAGQLRAARS